MLDEAPVMRTTLQHIGRIAQGSRRVTPMATGLLEYVACAQGWETKSLGPPLVVVG